MANQDPIEEIIGAEEKIVPVEVPKEGMEAKVGTGEIIYVPILDLTLLDANPRLIGKSELTKLQNSMEKDKYFFEARPCLVNKVGDKLVVYAGNQRVRAAINLGWRLVPCLIDEITPDLQSVRMFKDNMHSAEFDMTELVRTFSLGYLLQDAGFNLSKSEIGRLLKEDTENKVNADPDFVPEYVAKTGADGEDAGEFAESDDGSFFEDGTDPEEEELYIAGKFTNATKPPSFNFRQYEIPMAEDDYLWFKELLAEYKARNKVTTNFLSDFVAKCREGKELLQQ
ncbi:ParB/Sulfiredoxin [uncultured Caudovirales phage]|uniref:ParB/Sulfiredoxin n=1 Tax=uncultured Caudovirales phage TaxID=2100421 RepID=A0A6J5RP44_9CAUD|nr:ParB/Sulfiredoxin [uncultured Caudovirales phage]CAB4193614.1 ParB/Sulfiredoxin [uncultured Caudovirales phage]CAB4217512.1 ParB/Sulfiredoxin [uncultured Caudovirales phage]CAB5231366.1 ParB/Sulfiredoxin [uncultured Caudovirales phage]